MPIGLFHFRRRGHFEAGDGRKGRFRETFKGQLLLCVPPGRVWQLWPVTRVQHAG